MTGSRHLRLLLALLTSMSAVIARADSPLTLSYFDHYNDVKEVAQARFDPTFIAFLLGPQPLDYKAAAINALSIDSSARNHFAAELLAAIAQHRKIPLTKLQLTDLSGEEAFTAGYLRALEDYSDLTSVDPGASDARHNTPLELLHYAQQRLPESFTVALITALVVAQEATGCERYQVAEQVTRRFPSPRRDMRFRAVDEIMKYMTLYSGDCTPQSSADDEHPDAVYALARLGQRLAVASSTGMTLRDLATDTSETYLLGGCGNTFFWHDALWAHCQKGLYRFTGHEFKWILAWPQVTFLLGVDGKLYLFDFKQVKRMDTPDSAPVLDRTLSQKYYSSAIAPDGAHWGVVFLKSIQRTTSNGVEVFPLKSSQYPGDDPREFFFGPDGSIWVIDFEGGFFRYNTAQHRFELEKGSPTPASTLRIDSASGTKWLLGYRGELVVHEPDGTSRTARLGDSYYRDIALDGNGGAWIGREDGLLHVSFDGDIPRAKKVELRERR